MLPELLKHRYLLWTLTWREVRVRYARAALGMGWALFVPLVMMFTFTVLNFGRLIADDSPFKGEPYPLFAYCGILFWTHFSTSLTQGTPSLVISAPMIKKCAFPREMVPLSRILAALLDLGVGAAFLAGMMVWYGKPVTVAVLALPAVFALQLVFTAGALLILSGANVFFRDVNYFVQVGIILAMFATSVVYPVEPENPVARTVLALNPMSSYLDAYRQIVIRGSWPGEGLLVGALGALVSCLLGWLAFRRMAVRFAEEM
jgi:ABC-type polysaccharide/polyol phosphate export permease